MRTRLVAGLVSVMVAAGAAAADRLSHRVWIVDGTLAALTSAGVDGFVVPLGSARIATGSTTFTAQAQVESLPATGAAVSAAVWVAGEGEARGDAGSFWGQVAPAARGLGDVRSVVLIAREYWEGLPAFAASVAAEAGLQVEIMMSAMQLASVMPRGGWPEVSTTAVALGRPAHFSFPDSLLDDDLEALSTLDDLGVTYRAAIVILPWADPPPGPGKLNLRPLTSTQVVSFKPSGINRFELRRAIDWGGKTLAAGTELKLQATTTARYARDLGLLLRPVRNGLIGWDTVALPRPEPAIGMSREALIDFLRGGPTYPRPQVTTRWLSPIRLEIAIANPGPHQTGFGLGRNFVEISYRSAELRDLQLGDFASVEYGVPTREGWRQVTAPRSADALRLGFLFLPPHELLGGGVLTFMAPPRGLSVRWGVLPGDGSQETGPYEVVSSPER